MGRSKQDAPLPFGPRHCGPAGTTNAFPPRLLRTGQEPTKSRRRIREWFSALVIFDQFETSRKAGTADAISQSLSPCLQGFGVTWMFSLAEQENSGPGVRGYRRALIFFPAEKSCAS